MLLMQFAQKNEGTNCIDLGCGPGQTARFVHYCGIKKQDKNVTLHFYFFETEKIIPCLKNGVYNRAFPM